MGELFQRITKILQNAEGILFCGAGISLDPPAGLPDWEKLRDYTLQAVATKENFLSALVSVLAATPTLAIPGKKGLPPEVIASEIAANCQGYFRCFSVLEDGEPNANHLSIAAMAKAGYLKYVVTTNFDLFIERAMQKFSVECHVYRTEQEFRSFLENPHSSGVHLLKIHGCISLPETITSTVEQEGKGLSPFKLQALVRLYYKHYLIFWGYSGADLKIHLNYLGMVTHQKFARGFIWNFHQDSNYQEPINPYVEKLQQLYQDKSSIVHGQFPAVFRELLTTDIPTRCYTAEQKQQWQQLKNTKLQQSLIDWAAKHVGVVHACNIFGNLLLYIGEWQLSLQCFQYIEKIQTDPTQSKAAACSNIGSIYISRGEYHLAIEHFQKAIAITRSLETQPHLANYINNLGRAYRLLGDLDTALKYYQYSEQIHRTAQNPHGVVISLNNIGMVYHIKQEYDRALGFYQHAKQLAEKLGDKPKLLAQLNNIGSIYQKTGNFSKSLEYFEKTIEIAQALNDLKATYICWNNMGSIFRSMENSHKAIDLYKKALNIAEKMGDIEGIATTNENIAIVYQQDFKDYEQARKHYQESEQHFAMLAKLSDKSENSAQTQPPQTQAVSMPLQNVPQISDSIWDKDTQKIPIVTPETQELPSIDLEDILLDTEANSDSPSSDLNSDLTKPIPEMQRYISREFLAEPTKPLPEIQRYISRELTIDDIIEEEET